MQTKFDVKQVLGISAFALCLSAFIVPTAAAQVTNPKSAYLIALRQLGTISLLYASDYDDRLPQASLRRDTGSWTMGNLLPSPANVLDGSSQSSINLWSTYWRNSLEAYYAQPFPDLALPGGVEKSIVSDTFVVPPNITAATMNGLLHTYLTTEVPEPGATPMYWLGMGAANLKGRAFANPALNCGSSPTCRFHPSDPSGSFGGDSAIFLAFNDVPFWVYGGKTPMTLVDGSVKIVPIGTTIAPNMVSFPDAYTDPFSSVTATGTPASFWSCVGPNSTVSHPCYFRPDRTEPLP